MSKVKAASKLLSAFFLSLLLSMMAGCINGSDDSAAENSTSQIPLLKDDIPPSNCLASNDDVQWALLQEKNCNYLTDYRLITTVEENEVVTNQGLPYQLATELFTDYAVKTRFLFVPSDQEIEFDEKDVFSLPIGSVLLKNFAVPEYAVSTVNDLERDQRAPLNLIETRLLIHRPHGWVALPYIWNEGKTEAYLTLTGKKISQSIEINGVGHVFDYEVPTVGDCKTCHLVRDAIASVVSPIGIKARHLNRRIVINQDQEVNQLHYWQNLSLLGGIPNNQEEISVVPVWGDEQASLQDRAKGYLDINCSHCHNPKGAGRESGMFLEYWRQPEYFDHGICKRPGGFNGGEKGLVFDVVPGNAEQSLIPYRMSLLASEGNEKGQMPPLARHLNHEEGIALVRAWIDSMPARDCY